MVITIFWLSAAAAAAADADDLLFSPTLGGKLIQSAYTSNIEPFGEDAMRNERRKMKKENR